MTHYHHICIAVFICNFVFTRSEHVPTLTDINDYDDPVLNEVFASSRSKQRPEDDLPPQLMNRPPPSPGTEQQPHYYTNGEVPISHGDALGSRPQQQTDFSQLVGQGANVFATGANAFYRGAASVGQAFGMPQNNYQVPLFSQAAGLFGR